MKYGFKYNSNTSFKIVPTTDSAGYNISELKEIYTTHLQTELESLKNMTDDQFIQYFGVK
jgi:hypothetical protein